MDEKTHRPWGTEIQPYLAKLADHLEEMDLSGHSVSVPIGEARVLVTPLEQNLVLGEGQLDTSVPERLLVLVLDALGMQVKTLGDLRRLDRADEGEQSAAVQKIEFDVDLCAQLGRALQRELSALMGVGRVETAKKYQEYSTRLGEVRRRALEVVEGGGRPKSKRAPVKRPDARAKASMSATGPGRAHSGAEAAKSASRQRVSAVLAAVLLCVLVVVVVVQLRGRQRELQSFAASDFAGVPAIDQVVNRSPDLLLLVSETKWSALDMDARRQAVDAVVAVAAEAGYRRVEFRTRSRPGLAVWQKGGGVTVRQ